MSLITAQNMHKTYQMGEVQIQALQNASFSIEPGKFVSFIGPSGSGKTTLLNLIGCLDQPTQGQLTVDGQNVLTLNTTQRARFRGEHLGFIFQDFNLIPVLTVYENAEYPLIMVKRVPQPQRREKVLALLEAVGMLDQRAKFPSQISGGQKQRLAVARALTTDPKLVLADEPTANLDHASAYKVIDLMQTLSHERGMTFVFSTHDLKIVDHADVIYTLEDGKIVDQKTP
ncbi:ABC transporter related [Candidatus Vecturithrix granuli]|uniref:ABC transporter related n=1 Tax=Vecturithrix granuli TaxID=1499967 RepID=A0A081BWJ6_VECG1|nr:ABC transporter related [Candidatus Vecturithrix granuli]